MEAVSPAAALRAAHVLAVAFAAAVAVAALWQRADALSDRGRAALLAALVLAVNLALIPVLTGGMYPTADEPHYLVTAQSIVQDGDVDLRNDYAGDRYRAYYPERLPDVHGVEVGRAIHPIRDLGLPLLIAPAFALAGWPAVLALLALVGALLAAQLHLLLRDLGFAPRAALLAVAAAMLTHPLLTYSTQIYPDIVVALIAASAARTLGRGDALGTRALALCGLFAALLLLLSARMWPLAGAILAAAAFWALRRARRGERAPLAALAVAFAAGVAPMVVVNWQLFGLPFPGAGYWLIREQHDVAGSPLAGALGLLFDRGFGLIPRAPIYLLAFAGIAVLAARARIRAPLVAALALLGLMHVAFVSSLGYWHSHWSPPSRNLIAAAPLLVAGLAGGIELVGQARAWWVRAAVGVSLAWSILVTLAYAIRPRLRYDLPDDVAAAGTGALWRFVADATAVDLGRAFPLIVAPDAASLALAGAWTLLAGALVLAGSRAPLRRYGRFQYSTMPVSLPPPGRRPPPMA